MKESTLGVALLLSLLLTMTTLVIVSNIQEKKDGHNPHWIWEDQNYKEIFKK